MILFRPTRSYRKHTIVGHSDAFSQSDGMIDQVISTCADPLPRYTTPQNHSIHCSESYGISNTAALIAVVRCMVECGKRDSSREFELAVVRTIVRIAQSSKALSSENEKEAGIIKRPTYRQRRTLLIVQDD